MADLLDDPDGPLLAAKHAKAGICSSRRNGNLWAFRDIGPSGLAAPNATFVSTAVAQLRLFCAEKASFATLIFRWARQ
jgi:hypothetical protein